MDKCSDIDEFQLSNPVILQMALSVLDLFASEVLQPSLKWKCFFIAKKLKSRIFLMGAVSTSDCSNAILVSDSLSQSNRQILALSKAYQTVILLYEDDLSEKIQAAWAEKDRLNLSLRKIGEVLNGIEVFTFGLEPFPPGVTLELNLREASQDPSRQDPLRAAYKSLLNELILIQATLHPATNDCIRLQ